MLCLLVSGKVSISAKESDASDLEFLAAQFLDPGISQEPYAWMVYALAAFLDDVPLKPTNTLKSGMGNWITQARWKKKQLEHLG